MKRIQSAILAGMLTLYASQVTAQSFDLQGHRGARGRGGARR